MDDDCSCEVRRRLFLGRKGMTNLENKLKSRDIILPTKVCLVNAIIFPVITYECESWTIKKTECQKTGVFELWCFRRRLSVPWTARRWNQSILKEISPECSLEGLMLKLKLQYFSHLMQKLTHWKWSCCGERLKAGGEGYGRGWDGWMSSLTQWTSVWSSFRRWWRTGIWRATVCGVTKIQTQQSDWTQIMLWGDEEIIWIGHI